MKGRLIALCALALPPFVCTGLGVAFLDGYATGDRSAAVTAVRTYTVGARRCDAADWSAQGMSDERGASPSPLPGR